MAEELKERKAFEAHMRVGGYSNHDKHPDGSYVSSAMELWRQGWKARAQLPSQGGEAVAMRQRFSQIEDEIMAGKHTAASVFTQMRTAALYTHPADQVADGVVVSRELLLRIAVPATATDKNNALSELRALLAKP